jgi:multicomponent Na+:H+ antiporter subunit E
MKKYVEISVFLFGFWLILTWTLDWVSFFAGLVAVWGVVRFNRTLLKGDSTPSQPVTKRWIRRISFGFVLIKEIVVANIQVAKIVLDPKMPIQPSFFIYPLKLKEPVNQVLYANAITLTPGTLSVDLLEDALLIHALTEAAKEGLSGSDLEKAALALEDLHD